jgi:hypothetical protein
LRRDIIFLPYHTQIQTKPKPLPLHTARSVAHLSLTNINSRQDLTSNQTILFIFVPPMFLDFSFTPYRLIVILHPVHSLRTSIEFTTELSFKLTKNGFNNE